MDKSDALLEHALRYAEIGWAVFPCSPRGKKPAISGGRGCLDATTNIDQIRHWWGQNPELNIGLATGAPSGVVAVDIDSRTNGHHFWQAALDDHGDLPDGVWISLTGGGGWHHFFAYDNQANYDIAPGVEIKSTGKYVILPPSIHPTGNAYLWNLDHTPFTDDYDTTNDNDHTDKQQPSADAAVATTDDTVHPDFGRLRTSPPVT